MVTVPVASPVMSADLGGFSDLDVAATGHAAARFLSEAAVAYPYAVLVPVALIGAVLIVAGTRHQADELVARSLAEAEAARGRGGENR